MDPLNIVLMPWIDRSGKGYYDLVAARTDDSVALIRLELLYPFQPEELDAALSAHPNCETVHVRCLEHNRDLSRTHDR